MELEAHLNKESVLAENPGKKSYVYKRGPQSRTLIRERSRTGSFNEYPKELDGLWQQKSLENPFYDNQNHENCNCTCKCTPLPKQNPTCPPDDKRRRKREDKHHLRGRPFAQIQTEGAV